MPLLSRFRKIVIFLILISAIYLVVSFKPLTKQEQIQDYESLNKNVEPFRKNLTDCARQVKASKDDVQKFLSRIPQSTMPGKCFVACILKRNSIIKNNKIDQKHLLETNKAVFGKDSEVWTRLKKALSECTNVVGDIFEICEYASYFNDCMHMKMEQVLEKATMDRRMEELGQMTTDDQWGAEEDEILQLVKDDL